MPLKETCPSRDQLEEVMRGKVASPQMEILAHHMEACSQCEVTLQSLCAEDTFTDLFRDEAGKAGQPVEPVVKALIQRMQEKDRSRGNPTLGSHEVVAPSADAGTQAFFDAKATTADTLDFLAPPQSPDEVGRLGQYRVLKVLGKGGMGMVLMAHDPHLDRMAALKVILPSIAANETAKQRFLREARTAAKLRSDHIVTIYQVSEDRGIPYLAMEYLEGAPLDQFLAGDHKLSVAQILRIAREIAQGLADAHERGLIHRDIKPGNIWLDKSHGGRATILDFGLARFDTDIHITQSGAIIGTPAYMAPEQARGEKVDARADLFSLGCVLYRLCAGDIPFKAETTMGVLMALAMTEPTAPMKINSQIPPALSELIMQLLEKDAAKRPVAAREVVARLQEIERTIAGIAPNEETNVELSLSLPPMAEVLPTAGLLTALEQAKAESKPSTPPRKRQPVMFGAMVLLGMLVLGGAGTWVLLQMGVIRFSNEQGDYVITTDDPDFAFSVSKGAVILEDRKTKRKYNLKVVGGNKAAGEHELEVTDLDADLAFKTKHFTIKRGQEVALKAWFERKQVARIEPPVKGDETPLVPPGEHALFFNGLNFLELPLKMDPKSNFTFEAYCAPRGLQAGHWLTMEGLPAISINAAKQWAFKVMTPQQAVEYASNVKPVDWHRTHVALVADAKEIRLYINGDLAKSAPRPADLMLPAASGKMNLAGNFAGTVDEIRISKTPRYNKDFIPAERFTPDADTLALYHCDEGQGHILSDSSGNANHARAIAPKWVTANGQEKVNAVPLTPAQRKALEFVLSVNAVVHFQELSGTFKNTSKAAGIPAGPVAIHHIAFSHRPEIGAQKWGRPITDVDLEQLRDLPPIRHLTFVRGSNHLTAKGFETLSKYPGLKTVDTVSLDCAPNLGDGPVGPMLKSLGNLPALAELNLGHLQPGEGSYLSDLASNLNLQTLNIGYSHISEVHRLKALRSLRHLSIVHNRTNVQQNTPDIAQLSQIYKLHLDGSDIADTGLEHIGQMSWLKELRLGGTGITDKGLGHLTKMTGLSSLLLINTKMTEAGVKKFAAALPKCRIQWDGGVIEPTASAPPAMPPGDYALRFNGMNLVELPVQSDPKCGFTWEGECKPLQKEEQWLTLGSLPLLGIDASHRWFFRGGSKRPI